MPKQQNDVIIDHSNPLAGAPANDSIDAGDSFLPVYTNTRAFAKMQSGDDLPEDDNAKGLSLSGDDTNSNNPNNSPAHKQNAFIQDIPFFNPDFQIRLVPLTYKIKVSDFPNPEKTIILKKEKSGQIKAYLLQNIGDEGPMQRQHYIVSRPIRELNLSGCEAEVLEFPTQDEPHVVIHRDEYPELLDKVTLRCGLTGSPASTANILLFALGCGATTVAALAMAIGFGPLFFVLAPIIGISSTVANYRMSEFDLPEFFLGGISYLFQNKVKVRGPNGEVSYQAESISPFRQFLVGFGAVCSIFLGAAFGVLTFTSVLELPAVFGLTGTVASIFPPLGIILAAATFISLSIIMMKAIADLAKSKTISTTVSNIVNNIFHHDPEKDSIFYRALVWLTIGIVSTGALALTILGAIYTQLACAESIIKTFKLTSDIAKGAAAVIVGGFAMLAQIPFTVITTLNPILQAFFRWPEKAVAADINAPAANDQQELQQNANNEIDPNDVADEISYSGSAFGFIIGPLASFVNAIANAIIPLRGKESQLLTDIGLAIGTLGSFFISFLSTFGNRVSRAVPEPVVANGGHQASAEASAPAQSSNTTEIFQNLKNNNGAFSPEANTGDNAFAPTSNNSVVSFSSPYTSKEAEVAPEYQAEAERWAASHREEVSCAIM